MIPSVMTKASIMVVEEVEAVEREGVVVVVMVAEAVDMEVEVVAVLAEEVLDTEVVVVEEVVTKEVEVVLVVEEAAAAAEEAMVVMAAEEVGVVMVAKLVRIPSTHLIKAVVHAQYGGHSSLCRYGCCSPTGQKPQNLTKAVHKNCIFVIIYKYYVNLDENNE